MSIVAYAIYCEDIREEIDNQFSLIGCFKGHVKVEEFPVTVPKIAINVNWTQSIDEERIPVEGKVLYRHLDDDSLVELAQFAFAIDKAPVGDKGQLVHAGASFRMGVTLARPGILGVRLYRRGEEMRLRGLSFVPADHSETVIS